MPPFSGSVTALLPHAVGTWTLIGPTTAGFTVGNLGKRVSGTIPVTSAQFEIADDGSTIRGVSAVLDVDAIDTGHAKRDADLRKPGLLDLANHPQLIFTGTQVVALATEWTVTGELSAKGRTQEIILSVTADEPSGDRLRLRLTGQLDRRDFGVRAPRFMIGTLVGIEIEATFGR